jgi:hypothetical protein
MMETRSDESRELLFAMLLCALLGFGFAVALGHLDLLAHWIHSGIEHVLELLIDALVEPDPKRS